MQRVELPDKAGETLTTKAAAILEDFTVGEVGGSLDGLFAKGKDLFAEHRRKGWDKTTEARCNFDYHPHTVKRGGVWFWALWRKSVMGRTLTDIKGDEREVGHFAEMVTDLIREVMGESLSNGSWAICTTPKRRHKERNFATLISIEIAAKLGIPMHEDVATCRTRQRVNAEFELRLLPPEPNLIVFDDFVTTGMTLKAMRDLLSEHKKTMIFFTGIDNKL